MKDVTLALVAFLVVMLIWVAAAGRPRRARFGPHNIGLYDQPYFGYPVYEGRAAIAWDADGRCQASCQNSPCTIWCR